MMKYARRPAAYPAYLSLGLLVCLCACRSLPPAHTEAVPFYPPKLAEMDAAIRPGHRGQEMPGRRAVAGASRCQLHKAYGNRALVPTVEPMTEDTIFDRRR